MPRIIVITGTDTAAGKTVLTALLAHHLRSIPVNVAALKPICSGGRDDARLLRQASGNALPLDELNPWHFRGAIAPALAARHEGRSVALRDVVAHVRGLAHRFDVLLVEGAGGLLSPLGEHFSTREIISALGADVMVCARNQLGAVNHVRLTLEALPPMLRLSVRVALMDPHVHDPATRTNAALLGEFMSPEHIISLPWLARPESFRTNLRKRPVAAAIAAILHA